MLNIKKLPQGKEIDLFIVDGPFKGKYRSKIISNSAHDALVYAPYINGEVVRLARGAEVAVTFTDDVCVYFFETKVLGYVKSTLADLILELPKDFKRIQRREYVRVIAVYPLWYRITNQEQEAGTFTKGNTADLSGGGLSFFSNKQLEIGTLLDVRLNLPAEEITAAVSVQRLETTEEKGRYRIGCTFVSITKQDREKIIRSVFELQRDLRRKGLK